MDEKEKIIKIVIVFYPDTEKDHIMSIERVDIITNYIGYIGFGKDNTLLISFKDFTQTWKNVEDFSVYFP